MSGTAPTWLTPLIKLSDFEGDGEKYLNHLFSIFEKDFINSTPLFRGKGVFFDNTDDNGRPVAFGHITTETNKATNQRELCMRRCERIGWIKLMLENPDDASVLVWEKEHFGGKRISNRIYLFLECEDFLVILEEKKKGHFMITAIYVDNANQKKKHLKAYRDFHKISSI